METSGIWGESLAADPSSLPDRPGYVAVIHRGQVLLREPLRPFSSLAISTKVGLAGAGVDLATPLGERWNLRGGASFFSYNANMVEDSVNVIGAIRLRTVQASLDFYPHDGNFRFSPGLVFYNGNHVNAALNVPGGQSISFNDAPYTSSAADPISGAAVASFGHKVAPSLTFGWGNMIPRDGRHWSFPFEMGVQYIGPPKIGLNVTGSACQQGECGPISNDPETLSNVQAEQKQLTSDVSPLRFYPIVSFGVGYRF